MKKQWNRIRGEKVAKADAPRGRGRTTKIKKRK